MAVLASDAFTRADANTLGANWTVLAGWNDLGIISNAVDRGPNGQSCADRYSGITWPSDQYSQAKFVALASSSQAVLVRAASGANDFYAGGFDDGNFGGSKVPRIWKVIGGTATLLASGSGAIAANDIVKLSITGNTLTLYVNGTQKAQISDAELAAGSAGLEVQHTTENVALLDDWEGGDPNPIAVGWTRAVIGSGNVVRDTTIVLKGANSARFICPASGDRAKYTRDMPTVSGWIYRFSGAYYGSGFDPSKATFVIAVQKTDGSKKFWSDGRGYDASAASMALTPVEGEWRRWCFDFLVTTADALQLLIQMDSTAAAPGEVYVDDVKCQRVERFNYYEPRLGLDSLPEAETAALSLFFGEKTIGLGQLSILNEDGVLEAAFGQLLLFNKPAKTFCGGSFLDGQAVCKEDMRTAFYGTTQDWRVRDERIEVDLEDYRAFLRTELPLREYNLSDSPNMDLNRVGYSRPYLFCPSSGAHLLRFTNPARIDRTANSYGIYELTDTQRSPAGISSVQQIRVYKDEEQREHPDDYAKILVNPGPGGLDYYSWDTANGRFSILDNVKPHKFNRGSRLPFNALHFDVGGVELSRSSEIDLTANDCAWFETQDWTTAAGQTITWSYSHSTKKFTVTKNAGGTFNLKITNGANGQTFNDAWEALGFAIANRTGASAYTGDSPTFTNADTDHLLLVLPSEGWLDDANGTFTGTPSSTIHKGPDIVWVLLEKVLGLPRSQIVTASFVAARSIAGSNAKLFAWIASKESAAAILAKIEVSTLSDIVLDGDGRIYYVPYKAAGSPVRSFFDRDYLAGSWECGRRVEDIVTRVRVRHSLNPASGIMRSSEAVSTVAKGRHRIERTREFITYLTGEAGTAAASLAGWLLTLGTAAPLVATFRARSKLLDLKIGDRISLTRSRPAWGVGGVALNAATFRVRKLRHNFSTGVSECTCVEDVAV